MPGRSRDSVASWAAVIERWSDRHVDRLDAIGRQQWQRGAEPECIGHLERDVLRILDRYAALGPQGRGDLVFSRTYLAFKAAAAARYTNGDRRAALRMHRMRAAFGTLRSALSWSSLRRRLGGGAPAEAPVDDDVRASGPGQLDEAGFRLLMAALYAAEVERRGPFRLTQTQANDLAMVFEELGWALLREGLPHHAALAFDHAAMTYLQIGEYDARDRCLYDRACARRQTLGHRWRRLLDSISWAGTGYGLRPYRLLGWIGVQLVVFSLLLLLCSPELGPWSVYMVLVNYFNLLGVGDVDKATLAGRVLLVVEGYTGAVTSSVFFALLVRRWFKV